MGSYMEDYNGYVQPRYSEINPAKPSTDTRNDAQIVGDRGRIAGWYRVWRKLSRAQQSAWKKLSRAEKDATYAMTGDEFAVYMEKL